MTQQLPQTRYFNTGEVAINFSEWSESASGPGKSGPGFLFIHGITGRRETWAEVEGPIRQGARSVAVDLRGHGRSGHTTGAYRLTDYARDIAALIKHLELAPAVVVGHSLGAMTALYLAAARPELVRAIVLEDPPLFARRIMEEFLPQRHENFGNNAQLAGSGLSLAEMADQVRGANPAATEEDVQRSALSLFVTDADAIQHIYDERVDWSAEVDDVMRAVQCPALLMQGNFELGAWMLADDGVRARRLIPDCTLELWEDTGHSLHRERPERFIEQANRFVAGLKTAVHSS